MGFILEVIACSVADAVEAEAGGANRLEVVRDLGVGGLTPSISLVREILRAVVIPVRVMLRDNDGFSVGDKDALMEAAREFAGMGLDGVVLGFLEAGRLDLQPMRDVLAAASGLKATLHHAFDALTEPLEAIPVIKRELPQVDRILTRSGGAYVQIAAPEITILSGGGLDAAVTTSPDQQAAIRDARGDRSQQR